MPNFNSKRKQPHTHWQALWRNWDHLSISQKILVVLAILVTIGGVVIIISRLFPTPSAHRGDLISKSQTLPSGLDTCETNLASPSASKENPIHTQKLTTLRSNLLSPEEIQKFKKEFSLKYIEVHPKYADFLQKSQDPYGMTVKNFQKFLHNTIPQLIRTYTQMETLLRHGPIIQIIPPFNARNVDKPASFDEVEGKILIPCQGGSPSVGTFELALNNELHHAQIFYRHATSLSVQPFSTQRDFKKMEAAIQEVDHRISLLEKMAKTPKATNSFPPEDRRLYQQALKLFKTMQVEKHQVLLSKETFNQIKNTGTQVGPSLWKFSVADTPDQFTQIVAGPSPVGEYLAYSWFGEKDLESMTAQQRLLTWTYLWRRHYNYYGQHVGQHILGSFGEVAAYLTSFFFWLIYPANTLLDSPMRHLHTLEMASTWEMFSPNLKFLLGPSLCAYFDEFFGVANYCGVTEGGIPAP